MTYLVLHLVALLKGLMGFVQFMHGPSVVPAGTPTYTIQQDGDYLARKGQEHSWIFQVWGWLINNNQSPKIGLKEEEEPEQSPIPMWVVGLFTAALVGALLVINAALIVMIGNTMMGALASIPAVGLAGKNRNGTDHSKTKRSSMHEIMQERDAEHTRVSLFSFTPTSDGFSVVLEGRMQNFRTSIHAPFNKNGMLVVDRVSTTVTSGGGHRFDLSLSDSMKSGKLAGLIGRFKRDYMVVNDDRTSTQLTEQGEDWAHRLFDKIVETHIYHTSVGARLVATTEVDPKTDTPIAEKIVSWEDRDGEVETLAYYIALRVDRVRRRPFLALFGATYVQLDGDIRRLPAKAYNHVLAQLDEYMSARSGKVSADGKSTTAPYSFLTEAKGTAFFVKVAKGSKSVSIRAALKLAGILTHAMTDAFQIVRLALVMKRQGGIYEEVTLPQNRLPKEADGTIAIVEGLAEARQGTFIATTIPEAFELLVRAVKEDGLLLGYTKTMELVFAKGVGRGQLDTGKHEACGFGQEAAQMHGQLSPGMKGLFFVLARFKEFRASTNLQMILFSITDSASFLAMVAKRYRDMPIEELLTPREQAFVKIGMPIGLFIGVRAVYDLVKKYELPYSYSSQVIGATLDLQGQRLIGDDEVYLPFRIIKRIERKLGRELVSGVDQFIVERNPGLPNGSSRQVFVFGGVARYVAGTLRDGIVISCFSKKWQLMGGDFDGDPAVVYLLAGEENASRADISSEEMKELRTGAMEHARSVNGELDMIATHVATHDVLASKVGTTVNLATRLALQGRFTVRERIKSSLLVQGCIFAMKHVVDSVRLWDFSKSLWEYYGDIDEKTDLVGALGAIKYAKDEAKAEAWDHLVGVAYEVVTNPKSPRLASRLGDVVLAVDELRRRLELYNCGERIPKSLRENAEALLRVQKGADECNRQVTIARSLARRYGDAGRQYAEAKGNPEARREAVLRLEHIEAETSAMIARGILSPLAGLAGLSARLITRTLNPQDIEAAAITRKTVEVYLKEMVDAGEYKVEDLLAIASGDEDRAEIASFGGLSVSVVNTMMDDGKVRALLSYTEVPVLEVTEDDLDDIEFEDYEDEDFDPSLFS